MFIYMTPKASRLKVKLYKVLFQKHAELQQELVKFLLGSSLLRRSGMAGLHYIGGFRGQKVLRILGPPCGVTASD